MSLDTVGPDSTSPLLTPPSFQDDDYPEQSICDFADNFFNTLMVPFTEPPLTDLFEERREELHVEVLSVKQVPATSEPTRLITPTFQASQHEQDTDDSRINTPSTPPSLSQHLEPPILIPPLKKILACAPPYTIVLQNSHLFLNREDDDLPNSHLLGTTADPNVKACISNNLLLFYTPENRQLQIIKLEGHELGVTHIFRDIADFDKFMVCDDSLFLQRDGSLEIYNTSTMQTIAAYYGVESYLFNRNYLVLNCSRPMNSVHCINLVRTDLHKFTLREGLTISDAFCQSLSGYAAFIFKFSTSEIRVYNLFSQHSILTHLNFPQSHSISLNGIYLACENNNLLTIFDLIQNQVILNISCSLFQKFLFVDKMLFFLDNNKLSVVNLDSSNIEFEKENVHSFLILGHLLIFSTLTQLHFYEFLSRREFVTIPMRQIASASTTLYFYKETFFVQIDDTAVENFTTDFIQRAFEDRLAYPNFILPSSEAEEKKLKTPVSRPKTHASKKYKKHKKRHDPSISFETPITHKFIRTQQIRKFFMAKSVGAFSFSGKLHTYIKTHPEGTLGDIFHEWKRIYRH